MYNKYLSIKEKKELLLNGKDIPVCVYGEDIQSKAKRLIKTRKLTKNFNRSISK